MENTGQKFIQIPNSLLSNKDLSDQDKTTLGVILSFIRNGQECYIGNETLGEMLGITRKAASTRLLRLKKIGCIDLRYSYSNGKKEVDKRYITLISLTPDASSIKGQVSSDKGEVSSVKGQVSSDKGEGILSQGTGCPLTEDEVSRELRGIILTDNTNILNKLLKKGLDNRIYNSLDKEIDEDLSLEDKLEQISIQLDLIKDITTPEANERRGKLERNKFEYLKQMKLNK